jgi:hypothetical protein
MLMMVVVMMRLADDEVVIPGERRELVPGQVPTN